MAEPPPDVIFVESVRFVEITSVTLDAGQTSTITDIGYFTVDDDVVELTETVNLYIATVNGVPITDNGIDITINSNDSTEATLTVEDGREGDTTMATIDLGGRTLSSAIPSNALRLVLADGSTMNADVEIGATDIVAALKATSTVNVPIILKDDDLVEGTETVVVELRIDSTIAPGLEDLLTVGTSSFTIQDNDRRPAVGFRSANYEVNEGDGRGSGYTWDLQHCVAPADCLNCGIRDQGWQCHIGRWRLYRNDWDCNIFGWDDGDDHLCRYYGRL